jgi:arylsulfatase A-like enzyme
MQIWGTSGPERALRTERYKICARMSDADWWYDFQASEYRVAELYDLRSDPCELDNVFDRPAYSGVRKEMAQRLMRQIERIEGSRVVIA